MVLTFDRTKEYLIWDRVEPVSILTVQSQYLTTLSVSIAKRRTISLSDMPTQKTGVFTRDDLVWLLPTALLPVGFRALPGDVIRDAALVRWTVLDCQLWNHESTWRLNTRNLVLAENLKHTVSLQRPSNAPDGAGGRVATYSNVVANIPARIQEVGSDGGDNFGKRSVKNRYDIYLGQRVTWQATDRIVDQSGVAYTILTGDAPDIVDTLQTLHAERVP